MPAPPTPPDHPLPPRHVTFPPPFPPGAPPGKRLHGVPDHAPITHELPVPAKGSFLREHPPGRSLQTEAGWRRHLDQLQHIVNRRHVQVAAIAAGAAESAPPEQDAEGRPLLSRSDGRRVQPLA